MPIELKVPEVGESITEVQVGEWRKSEGEHVARDEVVALLETDKVTVELPAPAAGVLARVLVRAGESASVGQVIGQIEPSDVARLKEGPASTPEPPKTAPPPIGTSPVPQKAPEVPRAPTGAELGPDREVEARSGFARVMPSARRVLRERGLAPDDVVPTGPGGRLLKEDVLRHELQPQVSAPRVPNVSPADRAPPSDAVHPEEVVPMSPLRRRIAERLVEAQQNAALLTTFNEIDMSGVAALRRRHQEAFAAKHGTKLGLMSFFVKAAVEALKQFPQVNAEIRGTDIVFKNHYDIGVAVGGGRGLVVPVIRGAERLGFGEIERAIADYAARARDNKLKLEELQGGTFTITNGGVYGSLLSTPIINPPQSGVLGLHAIQDRPVVREGQVVVRPMMYVALTYDHRVVDGREAVTFLRSIKDSIEDPSRVLLEI